jgi:hypothetical protein
MADDEGLPFFVDQSSPAPVAINIESVGEILSHSQQATLTRSPAEDAVLYGDLPEALWKGRAAVETAWIAPKRDSVELESDAILYPERAIIVGTNGEYAYALECVDAGGDGPLFDLEAALKKTTSRTQLMETIERYAVAYEAKNAAFAYKRALAQQERDAVYAAERRAIRAIESSNDAKAMLARHSTLVKIDPTMRPLISRLGPRLTKALHKGNNDDDGNDGGGGGELKTAAREYAKEATFSEWPLLVEPVVDESITTTTTTFHMLVCRVPTPEKKKKPSWKQVDCTLRTVRATVPCVAFNARNQVAILYQPSVHATAVCVEWFALHVSGGGRLSLPSTGERVWFELPPCDAYEEGVFITMRMSEDGNSVAVGFGDKVVLVRRRRGGGGEGDESCSSSAPQPPFSLTLIHLPRHLVTSVSFSTALPETLLVGTVMGECYVVSYKEEHRALLSVMHVPAVEPLFAVRDTPVTHKFLMGTVSGIAGIISSFDREADTLTVLRAERPLAMDVCGQLVYVLSKYGVIQIHQCNERGVMHGKMAPAKKDNSTTKPLQLYIQHTYDGVRAFPDRVVAVYPDGMVRVVIMKE